MHVGTDHVPPSLGGAQGTASRSWAGSTGKNIELDLAEPRAGRPRGGRRPGVRPRARRRDRRVRGQVDRRGAEGDRRTCRIRSRSSSSTRPTRSGTAWSTSLSPSGSEPDRSVRSARRRRQAARALRAPRAEAASRAHARRPDGHEHRTRLLTEYKTRRSGAATTARAGHPGGDERAGSRAHLPVAASRRGRRRVPAVAEPPAQPLGADDPARRSARGSRSRPTARSGSSRARSSRTASTSYPIGRAGARYVDSILDGTPPAELAVQEIPDVEFAINLEDRQPARHQGAAGDDHPRPTRSIGSPVTTLGAAAWTRPARPHRRLIWKYTAVVVALVAAAIVSVGLTELYFSYQDIKRALTARRAGQGARPRLPRSSSTMQELLRQLEAVAQPTVGSGRGRARGARPGLPPRSSTARRSSAS